MNIYLDLINEYLVFCHSHNKTIPLHELFILVILVGDMGVLPLVFEMIRASAANPMRTIKNRCPICYERRYKCTICQDLSLVEGPDRCPCLRRAIAMGLHSRLGEHSWLLVAGKDTMNVIRRFL